ncbi:DUF2279 domain-containing protein [Flavobacteriaceae bacterium MHTCC 0001]
MWVFKAIVILLFLCFHSICLYSQSSLESFLTPSDTLNIKRRNAVVISESVLASATLLGLNEIWYADFERSKFHTVNDNSEWLQMDKFGHVFTAYQMGKQGANLLNWSGVRKKDQLLYGATLGFGFLTAVEVLDGYSSEWGFSWGDVGANAVGTGLYISQELLWNEQRIDLKFSFRQTSYAKLNPEKLGGSLSEQILKDYNGQTYWLSFNLHSFFKGSKIPKWLNVAIGYGGQGMLSGSKDTDNQLLTTIHPYRQYYISLDVNLNNLKTNSALIKTILSIINVIKVPFPTLEFNRNGVVFHPLHY